MHALVFIHLQDRNFSKVGSDSSGELATSTYKTGGNFGGDLFLPFQCLLSKKTKLSKDQPLNNVTTLKTPCSLSSSIFVVLQDAGGLKDTILGRSF